MKSIFVLLIFGLLTSCTVTKNKQSSESKEDSSFKLKSQMLLEKDCESDLVTTNKTTSAIDTNLVIPGESVSASKPVTNLMNGETLEATSNGLTAKVSIDKNGNLNLMAENKPKAIPVHEKRISESKSSLNKKEKSKEADKKDQASDVKKDDKKLDLHVVTEWFNWDWLWWLLLLLIPIGYWAYKKAKLLSWI